MTKLPVGVLRAAVAVPLLLPPPVPVDQLTEVGRLLTVFDDELVFEELLGCGTLHEERARRQNLLALVDQLRSGLAQRREKDESKKLKIRKRAVPAQCLMAVVMRKR